jgi:hypothetical protein
MFGIIERHNVTCGLSLCQLAPAFLCELDAISMVTAEPSFKFGGSLRFQESIGPAIERIVMPTLTSWKRRAVRMIE